MEGIKISTLGWRGSAGFSDQFPASEQPTEAIVSAASSLREAYKSHTNLFT